MSVEKPCSLKLIEAQDVTNKLPSFQLWESRSNSFHWNLLVLAAGFEDRVLAFPQELQEMNFDCILVGDYSTNREENETRYMELEPLLSSLSNKIVHTDADNPESVHKSIREITADYTSRDTIVFDISSCSSPFILSVIGAISEAGIHSNLSILYAEAEKYFDPKNCGGDSSMQTPEHGVSSVKIDPYMVGEFRENSSTHVVCFPVSSSSRTARCLSHFSEEFERFSIKNTTWVLPSSIQNSHSWRKDYLKGMIIELNGKFSAAEESDYKWVYCDSMSYSNSAKIVLELTQKYLGQNLGVIAMGSKMQTLGVALALTVRGEVRNVYARPERFEPLHYSKGVGKLYVLELGRFDLLKTELSKVGDIQFQTQIGAMEC